MKILEFRNVGLVYQTVQNETAALENITFDVSDGEFTANIDKAGGEGTARFAAEAIKVYCKEQKKKH